MRNVPTTDDVRRAHRRIITAVTGLLTGTALALTIVQFSAARKDAPETSAPRS